MFCFQPEQPVEIRHTLALPNIPKYSPMTSSMLKQKLNHSEIELRLPHSGNMCLLDEITQADELTLTAQAISHRDIHNPLRLNKKISSINGIEYAAQAMAVHGSLLSEQPQAGYIATVRNIEIKTPYLFDEKKSEGQETGKGSPLLIKVEQLMSNENGFTYQFYISCEQQALISGKITVFLTQT